MGVMISFVVTARNDNYGGDFLRRMQSFVNILTGLSKKYHFDVELVIVEWNPPSDKTRLAEALVWPERGNGCNVRIIEVPDEVHRTIPHSDKLPLFEFIGKNTGIRRSKGEFILATNPDILFSEELIRFLSKTGLSRNTFYRATRYDIDAMVPPELSLEQQLEYCGQHIVRVNGTHFTYEYIEKNRMAYFSRWMREFGADLIRMIHSGTWRRPFTNASGDFMLMHRDHWNSLKGYPEIIGADEAGFLHIDSLLVYSAIFSGMKQKKLKESQRIYHQEHGRERSRTPFSSEISSARQLLLKERKPVVLNDETWGLSEYQLLENTVA